MTISKLRQLAERINKMTQEDIIKLNVMLDKNAIPHINPLKNIAIPNDMK